MFGSYQRFVVHVNTLIDKIVERGQEMMWEWDQERVCLHDVCKRSAGPDAIECSMGQILTCREQI